MKILYAASTARHLLDNHLVIIEKLQTQGHCVTVVCCGAKNEASDWQEIPFAKGFFSLNNLKALNMLKKLCQTAQFDLVLTHTALAGFVTRLAVMLAGKGKTICIHTAHGYLFGKGTNIMGKLTYPFELLSAPITDAVLTMNAQDYRYAQRLVRRNGKVKSIPGMGVDLSRFRPPYDGERAKLRHELHLPDGFLLVYAAEFSARKNHAPLLKAMKMVVAQRPDAHLLLAGDGKLQHKMKQLTYQQGLESHVHFLGYLPDTSLLLRACDTAVSSSLSEGLPVFIMESFASGCSVVASFVKGHEDLFIGEMHKMFEPRSPLAIYNCLMTDILHTNCDTNVQKRQQTAIIDKLNAANDFIQTVLSICFQT